MKNAVHAIGDAGKGLMRDKVIAIRHLLNYNGIVPLEELDEHSIDALAVAYTQLRLYQEAHD